MLRFAMAMLLALVCGNGVAMIGHWTREHPNARLVPVSVLGERSPLPIVYAWAVDGEDNLNLLLVRQGVYPALVMLDTPQFSRPGGHGWHLVGSIPACA